MLVEVPLSNEFSYVELLEQGAPQVFGHIVEQEVPGENRCMYLRQCLVFFTCQRVTSMKKM